MTFDFVAIDFETANNNNSSACSMGLVMVKDKEIVDKKYFLIHPPTLNFDEKNISIHGITPDDVRDAPYFDEVWEQIKHYFYDNIIVAHNAQFDMSVLHCCLREYNLDIHDFNYLCSIPISTKVCRGEGIGNSLVDRANRLGIDMEAHHNALSDATVCAKLVIETVNRAKRKSFKSFCTVFSSLPIKRFSELKPNTEFKRSSYNAFNKIIISEITAASIDFDKDNAFYGKSIVFTGELKSLDRKDAMQKVVNLGGIVKSAVSSKTDYLIVGLQDKSLVGDDGLSSKEEKAYELIEKGHTIKIITEDDFRKML